MTDDILHALRAALLREPTALHVARRLAAAGHRAVIVGGAVRDVALAVLHGAPEIPAPGDWDVATSAAPPEVLALFPDRRVDMHGKAFLVCTVDGVEVATFRRDTSFPRAGMPDVAPVPDFDSDARRRDFTINAIGAEVAPDGTLRLTDPAGGLRDLAAGVVRAVGDPDARLREDPARILRALGLAARLGFRLDPATRDAVCRLGPELLRALPAERVGKEMGKVAERGALARWMELIAEHGLLPVVFPELSHLPGLIFSMANRSVDLWQHTLAVVRAAEVRQESPLLSLAALYHECGRGLPADRVCPKPAPPGFGHSARSAAAAYQAILRLQWGKQIAADAALLIAHHLARPRPEPLSVMRTLRRLAAGAGEPERFRRLVHLSFCLWQADAAGLPPPLRARRETELHRLFPVICRVLDAVPFYPQEAGIRGEDILAEGFSGPAVGQQLKLRLARAQQEAALALLRQCAGGRGNGLCGNPAAGGSLPDAPQSAPQPPRKTPDGAARPGSGQHSSFSSQTVRWMPII